VKASYEVSMLISKAGKPHTIAEEWTVPREWNNVILVPIFKKGDKKDHKNHRGISLLNACCEIYAKYWMEN
jgi:hypothetical protein